MLAVEDTRYVLSILPLPSLVITPKLNIRLRLPPELVTKHTLRTQITTAMTTQVIQQGITVELQQLPQHRRCFRTRKDSFLGEK